MGHIESIWDIQMQETAADREAYLAGRVARHFAAVEPSPEVISGYVSRMRKASMKWNERRVGITGPWTWKAASDASLSAWLSAGGENSPEALRLARVAPDPCHFTRRSQDGGPDQRVASSHVVGSWGCIHERFGEDARSLLNQPRWGGVRGYHSIVSGRPDSVISTEQREALAALEAVQYRVNPEIRRLAEAEGLTLPVGPETFSQKYFLDWRGRIYGSGAGAQGPDHIRAMVDLATPEPVSAQALAYAKTVIAEEYGAEIVENAATIAADPARFLRENRHGKRFRALRAALAIVEVGMTGRSGYILQQDAHCSGFQHIALMWGDQEMAAATNLTERGNDLYLRIANAVADALSEDDGSETGVARLILDHRAAATERTVAKPVVMLTGYGSSARSIAVGWAVALGWQTLSGDDLGSEPSAALASAERDAFWAQAPPETMISHPLRAMVEDGIERGLQPRAILEDLASKYSEVMGREFPSIQALKAKVGEVFRSFDQYTAMRWTSPVGMRCESSVVVAGEKGFPTGAGWKEGPGALTVLTSPAGAMPNFVHSVDAALVAFAAIAAAEEGISVTPIHDSFGTSMAHAMRLRDIVAEQMLVMDSYGFFTDFCVRAGVKRPGSGRIKRHRIEALSGTVIG